MYNYIYTYDTYGLGGLILATWTIVDQQDLRPLKQMD